MGGQSVWASVPALQGCIAGLLLPRRHSARYNAGGHVFKWPASAACMRCAACRWLGQPRYRCDRLGAPLRPSSHRHPGRHAPNPGDRPRACAASMYRSSRSLRVSCRHALSTLPLGTSTAMPLEAHRACCRDAAAAEATCVGCARGGSGWWWVARGAAALQQCRGRARRQRHRQASGGGGGGRACQRGPTLSRRSPGTTAPSRPCPRSSSAPSSMVVMGGAHLGPCCRQGRRRCATGLQQRRCSPSERHSGRSLESPVPCRLPEPLRRPGALQSRVMRALGRVVGSAGPSPIRHAPSWAAPAVEGRPEPRSPISCVPFLSAASLETSPLAASQPGLCGRQQRPNARGQVSVAPMEQLRVSRSAAGLRPGRLRRQVREGGTPGRRPPTRAPRPARPPRPACSPPLQRSPRLRTLQAAPRAEAAKSPKAELRRCGGQPPGTVRAGRGAPRLAGQACCPAPPGRRPPLTTPDAARAGRCLLAPAAPLMRCSLPARCAAAASTRPR